VRIRLALDARKLTDYGIGTYLCHLVNGLAVQPDLQLTLLVKTGHEERASAMAPTARILSVSAGEYTVSEHLRLPFTLWREPIDLIHFPHYVVPRFLPTPAVVTVHDVIQLFYPPERRWQLALVYLRLMLRSSLKRARRVITVSRASRRDLINLFAADPKRLAVVPNGVEERLGARPAQDDIDAVRHYYGLRPPLVLVVANDKPHKNLDMVLRAYAVAVRRQRLPGQLVFVGGLGPNNRLERRAEQLGLADRVRSLGRVPVKHLHTMYHLGAVLLHVALYEGFGLPVLEAMRAELPVVTSNLGAMREVGEGAARLVNPLDVGEIADALTQVLVDDALRRRMVEAGVRRARHLTWERTVEGTLAVYRQALEG